MSTQIQALGARAAIAAELLTQYGPLKRVE